MRCAGCGQENREGRKFCGGCGTRLASTCPACGTPNEPDERFCGECGAALSASAPQRAATPPRGESEPSAAAGARTVVSILFADLVGSTALHERLDAESVRQFMERYYAAMRSAVEAHGGRVTQVMGDGVKAVFGAPRVAEDDAIRAVRAGVEMQRAFRALADEQRGRVGKTGLRVAVNTGEVVSDGESEIIGDPVNVAARLQEQGKDGDVVIGGSTQRIVAALVTLERLGSFALKGRSEQVEAYRVVSLEPPAAAKAAFVGRDDELARLTRVYESAVAKPAAQLAVLLGSPGLGKSRLIDEFVGRLGDAALVFTAHCDASGGATFAPLGAALRERLGVEDRAKPEVLRAALEAALPGVDADRARVVAGVLSVASGAPSSPEETFFAIRRLLATFAQAKPVVLVIDDLHWAESLLLDLVEHLVQWGSGVPLFVLVGARPELRELRSSLALPGGLVSDVLTLSGLDAGAAMRLAAGVIGAADLPAALAAKLLATSEGNPLFVGELIKMLVQEGVLQRDGERWVASAALADLEMPPTIHALLAARIERLRPEERAVLERAAVVGRHFSKSAVAALLSQTSDLDARLEALRRSELIERDTGWFLGEPVLRFHHVLIRDAAYRRILKGTRAELHARLAGWIEAKVGEAAEHDEVIGWHLEQAHQHLAELGPLDANGVELGARAARRLAAAGRRELARDDVALAASLLARALACLPPGAEERADLALDSCEALLSAGDVANAAAAIDELGRLSEASPRLRAWHTCFAGQLATLTSPQGLKATADSVSQAAAALAALGDDAGEAKAHFVNAQALARLGKVGACEAALDLALAAARRAGDRRRANAVLAGAPRAALWGPSPVTRASGRCLDVVRVLRITQGAPAVEAVALSCQGVLEALRGRTDAAKRMIASARKLVEELGIAQRLFETDVFAGRVALLEGDAGGAERSLRGAYEGLRDLGLGIDAAQAAALLARALLAQGRAAEAEAISHESEALAGDDLQAAIAWRGARAEALAQRGERDEAVQLAQAAVEIASATDALLDHADARVALAAALRAAGRSAEADAETRRARELWETKGATLLAERTAQEGTRAVSPAAVAAPPTRRRRVRPNAASENAARLDAAVASRDGDALQGLFAEDIRIREHVSGASFDRPGAIASYRGLIAAVDPKCQHDLLATLGESLALFRVRLSASGSRGRSMDVGPYEKDEIHTVETDAEGRRRAGETWSMRHLGDGVARLYERYAELLPAGPERERAATTARAVAAMLTASVEQGFEASIAPGFEAADHRLVGHETVGAAELQRGFDARSELEDESSFRVDDVLALSGDALLRRTTHSGIVRASGGSFERTVLALTVFGPDGRITRYETFDVAQEDAALARFDALAGGEAPPRPAERRVRANAASALAARFEAAFSQRDEAALAALWSDSLEVVDHPTGACYGREGHLDSLHRLARANTPAMHIAPLATLGEDLLLARRSVSASGTLGGRFDVGAWERTEPVLFERDTAGRFARVEIFASDRLGDAIARLYERYAERLPEGPERARAARAAQSQAALITGSEDLGSGGFTRLAAAHAPDFEAVDHRRLGLWSGRAAGHVEQLRSWQQVADDVRYVTREILALEPGAVLAHVVNTGTDRAFGGDYERPFLSLSVTDAEGRLARLELFDAGRESDALARFDALAGGEARPVRRRLPDTAATRAAERLHAADAARDLDAIAALHADPVEVIHHPSGASYGLPEQLKLHRSLWRGAHGTSRAEPLAALGDSLALSRRRVTHEGVETRLGSIGPVEVDIAVLLEVDERGLVRRSEVFDHERLGSAVVRLYERYAEQLPGGPEKARAESTARSLGGWVGPVVLEYFEAAYAPDFEQVDHRTLGSWSARGRAQALSHVRSVLELASDISVRVDDVLAAAPSLVLDRRTHLGTDLASGGRYERPFLALFAAGADGRIVRVEVFDPDREADALARFDALAAGSAHAPAPRGFENAAAHADERLMAAFNARDWPGVLACAAPSLVFDERRRMTRNFAEREVWLEQLRLMFDQPRSRFTIRLVATRGERLSLHRHEFAAEVAGGGGPLEMEPHFSLHEVDAEGRIVAIVLFDLDDEAAAYAELDARFEAGEGTAHPRASAWQRAFSGALARRDWDALAETLAPSFVAEDHRLAGWGTLEGPARFVDVLRAMVELASDAHLRVDHQRASGRWLAGHNTWVGTREGGAFEIPFATLLELDAEGRAQRLEQYDSPQAPRVLARFAELGAGETAPPAALGPFANLATRAVERGAARVAARDWEGFRALMPPGLRYSDRTAIGQLETGRDEWLAAFREQVEMTAGPLVPHILATRGERLALVRMHWRGAYGDVGESELDWLLVIEADARGDHSAVVSFEPSDLAGAYRELDARYADCAIFAAVERVYAASYRRDREACLAEFAPGWHADDHRRLGWGRTLDSAEMFFRAQQALLELAPDFRYRVDHFAVRGRAFLTQVAQVGTREGGPFESPFLYTGTVDERGLLARYELYDVEDVDAARARFDALAAEAPAEAPFANAATRAEARIIAAWEAHDLEGFARQVSEGFHNSDRRRAVQLELDRDATLAFSRSLLEGRSGRIRWENLATRGERLALSRWRVEIAGGEVGESEIPYLGLCEVDERGAPRNLVRWDDDALEAALAELEARFDASDRSAGAVWLRAFGSALERRDWDAVAAAYAPDFVGYDHRLVGWGTLRGPAAFLESLRQMFALAPDAHMRAEHVRTRERAVITASRWVGTREGGAFESPFVVVIELAPDRRALRADFYDPQHLSRALARFEEIRAGARRDPIATFAEPNQASAWLGRFQPAFNARDWDALRTRYAPNVRYEDRQRLSLVSGGIDTLWSSMRARAEAGARLDRFQLLGSAGDRVAIQRLLWTGGGAEGRFEMEFIAVQEVDEAGRLVATINFDPGDARAAQREAWARWAARDPVAAGWVPLLNETTDAWNAHDAARVRNIFADGLVVEDHRFAGIGRIEGADAYVDTISALWELAPDQQSEFTRCCAIAPHAVVLVLRRSGLIQGGGAFENEYAWLAVARGGRIARLELWEIEHLGAALARFEALRPAAPDPE